MNVRLALGCVLVMTASAGRSPAHAQPSLETVHAHIKAEKYESALADLTVIAATGVDSNWFFYKAQVQFRKGWCRAADTDAAISLALAKSGKDALTKQFDVLRASCKKLRRTALPGSGSTSAGGLPGGIIVSCGTGGGFTGKEIGIPFGGASVRSNGRQPP